MKRYEVGAIFMDKNLVVSLLRRNLLAAKH
jgi:hypothetical protein